MAESQEETPLKLLPLLFIFFVLPTLCFAGSITLKCDADATWTAENCTGVIIYASPAGADTWVRVAKVPYPATSVRLRLPDIAGGYDYKATAYKHNPWQESAYSNTVTGTPNAAKSDKAAVLVVVP